MWENFVGGGFEATNTSRLCTEHFADTSYTLQSRLLGLTGLQRRLADDTVPSLRNGLEVAPGSLVQVHTERDPVAGTCRLCKTTGPGVLNIFEESLNNVESSYSGNVSNRGNNLFLTLQIHRLYPVFFQLADLPNWPNGGCRDYVEFLEEMKQFNKRIIETHYILDEQHQTIARTDRLPIESVFVLDGPMGGIKEEGTIKRAAKQEPPDEATTSEAPEGCCEQGPSDIWEAALSNSFSDQEKISSPD